MVSNVQSPSLKICLDVEGSDALEPLGSEREVFGMSAGGPLAIGDVLYLHDITDTNFSDKDAYRWWIVIALAGTRARIAPRSVSARRGVEVPASAHPRFSKDARVPRTTTNVGQRRAVLTRVGRLPEPYLSQVLEQFGRRRGGR